MAKLRTLALVLCALLPAVWLVAQKRQPATPAPVPGTTTIASGEPGHSVVGWVDIVPFTSETFHNTRKLRVWLPGNYFSPHNASRKYPVLYLQDGQNLFDDATAFAGEWHVDETVDHLVGSFKIAPMIVVGIDHAGEQRAVEYLPYPDPHNPAAAEVKGKEYPRFLVREVMPFIEKRYRVATGAANTGIGGASYGGIASLYAALQYPRTFGKVLVESPSLFVGDQQLLRDSEKAKQLPERMFLAVGTTEGREAEHNALQVKVTEELAAILRKKGMGANRLKFVVEEGAHHNEEAWSRRLPDALLFLYGH
jgi:predicted alpha/beta superfamily hydrolase